MLESNHMAVYCYLLWFNLKVNIDYIYFKKKKKVKASK